MQGTWVRSLLQEDSTCLRATEPRAAATWPALQSPCSSTGEATTVRSLHPTARGQPLLPAARESPHAATNAQHSPKWIRSKKKNISVHEVLGRNWTCKQNTRCSGWQRSREKNRMCPPSPQHTSAPLRSFQVAQRCPWSPWGWLTPSFHSWGHQGPEKGRDSFESPDFVTEVGWASRPCDSASRVPLRLSADPTNHSQICFLADGWRA